MEKSLASREYRILVQLLRATRKAAGVTQIEMAQRLDEVQSFVSSCERGQRRLDMVEVWRWCQALGVSFPEFTASFDARVRSQQPGSGQ